jgi:ubiquitin carboxyl-terminal hydrolase 12/46
MKELRRLDELARLAEAAAVNASNAKLNLKAYRALSGKQSNGIAGGAGHANQQPGNFVRNGSNNGSSRSMSSKNSVNSKATDPSENNKNGADQANNNTASSNKEELTWIHELFQGILVNETKCLNCETVSIFNIIFNSKNL